MIVDRKNILKIDWTLILIYISLAGFGIGNILSSSISGEEFKLFNLSTLYGKQLIFAIFSFENEKILSSGYKYGRNDFRSVSSSCKKRTFQTI